MPRFALPSTRVALTGFALIVSLSGCGHTEQLTREVNEFVAEQRRELAAAPVCCSDVEEIEFLPVSAELQKVEVSAKNARMFKEGKSYFLAVETPEILSGSYLLVKSNTVHWNQPGQRRGLPHIFKPSVVAFDTESRPSGKWLDLDLCYNQGWGKDRTGYFSVIRIEPEIHRKLVFYSTQSALLGSTHFGNSATTAGGGAVVNINVNYDFPHSPVGALEIGPLDSEFEEYLRERCPVLF